MKDAYTKLMVQQHTSEDATFYEKLENIGTGRKHKPVWKAAIAAACMLLMIPVSVWAAESIFGIALITIKEGKDMQGKDAIVFHRDTENVGHIPITEFSPYLQSLKETERPLLASWEAAEEQIGIDFLTNTVLEDEGTKPYVGRKPKSTPFEGVYYVYNEQLFAVSFSAEYFRNRIKFEVTANATTDHPLMTEEYFTVYHGFGERYYDKTDNISIEQYVTKNGIPATIFYSTADDWGYIDPIAYCSVNNISYHISITQWNRIEDDETAEETNERMCELLREILDGFIVQ